MRVDVLQLLFGLLLLLVGGSAAASRRRCEARLCSAFCQWSKKVVVHRKHYHGKTQHPGHGASCPSHLN
ncbi:hypothetical protein EYF80_018370 [Liparis tanakae]|uniref:C2H2-type domain-containing protein n=1 Tax=Liparis tanakae TaxID=230148 RepID=A0A4Z2I0T1_9TELE|nr:hypothetical protein EYF80_018370 [Liparis tanakae]